jgi:hypothetical protein
MTDDAHRLLQLQSTYEAELEHKFSFVGLSVDEFVSALIREGFSKRSERVRVDWKIPDKRWYWVKLKALTDAKDWDALEAFAKSKKSPIGYEPFVVGAIRCRGELIAGREVADCVDTSTFPHTAGYQTSSLFCPTL